MISYYDNNYNNYNKYLKCKTKYLSIKNDSQIGGKTNIFDLQRIIILVQMYRKT